MVLSESALYKKRAFPVLMPIMLLGDGIVAELIGFKEPIVCLCPDIML